MFLVEEDPSSVSTPKVSSNTEAPDLVSPEQRHQVLIEWNNTGRNYPLDQPLHHFFETQVLRTPDAVAVQIGAARLTYSQLNQRANQLAGELIHQGVGPDILVGVYAVRSLEMVVGLLAILKASGAYVPIDPEYPADRVAYMLADSGIPVLLTTSDLQGQLSPHTASVICLDAIEWALQDNSENPPRRVASTNLAYMIYTSGSTGRPKGALNTHRGIVNRLFWMQEQYQLTAADVVLQKTPFSFDVSVWEFFWPLITGARLCLAKPGGHRDPSYLVQLIQEQGVTVLHFVPSMLSLFLTAADVERCTSIRHVICSGEALTADLRDRLFNQLKTSLHNLYGPTEAAVDVTHWTCHPSDTERFVPIGKPIANTQCYILNEALEPVPVGVPAELYLGGVQIGRGYHGQPELTSQKFIPDRFQSDPAARLYKTGDLCRFLPDGNIQFLGRLDNQVKIRGFRIELDEIESVLGNHPDVLRCVVLAEDDSEGGKVLVAYLVQRSDSCLSSAGLRTSLASQLPDYMIPTRFLAVATLPLTPNGKVDRKGLQQLNGTDLSLGTEFREPVTSLEKTLAGIWETVLGGAPIGLDDHFLDLGGHSLRAALICARIGDQLQRIVPPKWIFESPTIAELSKRIEFEQDELTATVPIPRIVQRDQLPASAGQQGMWLLQQLAAESATYNQPYVWRFQGPVDIPRLQKSLRDIVHRHEILRAGLVLVDDALLIDVQDTDAVAWPWSERTMKDLHFIRDNVALMNVLREEARKPFDLSRAPLWRVCLLEIADEERILLVTIHHSIIDEWSIRRFIHELEVLCTSDTRSQHDLLPDLSIQYADFAGWQRSRFADKEIELQRRYWRQQLADLPAPLVLGPQQPRDIKPSGRGSIHEFEISGTLVPGLRQLARDEQTTVFAVLLAGFQACLYRHSGQTDLVIGTPFANRKHPQVESLIGFFLNTLPIRNDLDPTVPFRGALRKLNSTLWDAYTNSEFPFEQMVELSVHDRVPGCHPVFQAMFVLLEEGVGSLKLGDVTGEPVYQHTGTSKVDLTLDVQASGDEWVCRFEYATDLFEAEFIAELSGHFRTMMATIVENPDTPLEALPLLNVVERDRLVTQWNQTDRNVPQDICIHQLFEQQVERCPDSVALVFREQLWTYRRLNDVANRLAHDLRQHHVGPDVLVGLLAERTPELLVGLLAILKAGGAYVPLDPAYPSERLRVILEDARISVLLSQQHLSNRLPVGSIPVVNLSLVDVSSIEPLSNIVNSTQPSDLAYVLYTSGSTGKPKGVAMEHRSLVNLIDWQNRQSDVYRTLQFASVGFDVSFQEIFSTWTTGGTLILTDEATRRDLSLLVDTICQQKIERLFVPYVVLQQLAELGMQRAASQFSLREVITAGEQLLVTPVLKTFFARLPQCRLVNQYGPTEAHVVTSCALDVDPSHWTAHPPIGRPIDNNRIYILDARLQPVPPGLAGELYISGRGVARGYLNNPGLSAEKFLVDPFPGRNQMRMYRTGDKACWRADGMVEFLGRIDQQVKFRGFRIELGEIEAVLNAHPQISQSVVVLREDRPGDKRIVAYLVSSHHENIAAISNLRKHLARHVPEYMIPSIFVFLDALPMTVNGKVNRRSLPVPAREHTVQEQNYTAPRTPVEAALAQAWENVLGIDRIGIHVNFFEMGGHSLMATRLVSQIRAVMNRDISIRSVFESPTIASMATEMESAAFNGESAPEQGSIPSIERGDLLPMSFSQERFWFLDQYEQNRANYNLPCGWHIQGPLDRTILEKCLQELVYRHEPLHTTFVANENERCQRIHPSPRFELVYQDLRNVPLAQREEQLRKIVNDEVTKVFDLASDLMLRATLIQQGNQDYLLLLVMHHIASDGWSLGVMERELASLYQSVCDGGKGSLPVLSVQYADYAVWQRNRLQGDLLRNQLDYWKKQLDGIPELLELPTDFARPVVQGFRGAKHEFRVDATLTQSLMELSRHENATLFMTLLAAWQVLLSRYSGQTDVVVGAPVSGRNYAELESLIGLFVNTLVLRTNVASGLTVRELLEQVRETTLGAYAHQDIPFEKLVHDLNPPRTLSHSPVFQVMFSLQPAEGPGLQIPELSVQPLVIESATAKFDLVLVMTQTDQGLQGILEYDADLFLPETIQRMIEHYRILLEGFVYEPRGAVDRLPLLSPSERHKVLVDWNQTQSAAPVTKSVHRIFEEQAERMSDATAIEFEGQLLTYGELNKRANQLARHLNRRGVGQDVRVGISADRSLETIIGLLAILKAGAAYVPLDACYPDERLSYLVADTGLTLILTQSHLQSRWHNFPVELLVLDSRESPWNAESTGNLHGDGSGDELAYLIYTSGSTGQPKGVEVLHRGIVRLVCDPNYVRLDATQTILHLAVLSFDASTFEIWGPLLNGGRCVLAPNQLPTADELGRLIREKQIRTLWLTSTLFNAIVDDQVTALEGLEQLLVGGESLSVPHVQRAQRALGSRTHLINGYGPTECTTFACCYPLPDEIPDEWNSIPIGRPISNTTAYVLDPNGQPVPIGVFGELCLGGDGLARGYLNQPELTSERFVMSSLDGFPDQRIYRTGDIVRWKPDATIEFRGRRDQQIKLRGFRIELGEIETALLQQPGVRQAVVVVRETKPGNNLLVAYIVPATPGEQPVAKHVRQGLRSHLPEYMIPTAFVEIAELPRNANGKIDRPALPVPELDWEPAVVDSTCSPLEGFLIDIWKNALSVENVGVHDNFFDLGGHSLLAIRVVDKINQTLNKRLKVIDLFSNPTISGLARCVDESNTQRDSSQNLTYLEPIRRGACNQHLVIVGATLRVQAKDFPEGTSIWWLKLDGLHVQPHLDLDIPTQAQAFAAEVISVIPEGTIVLCGHSYGGLLAMELAQRLKGADRYRVKLVLLEPSPAWRRSESFLKQLARKAKSLKKPNRIGRIRHLVRSCSSKIASQFIKPLTSRQHTPTVLSESDESFRRMVPFFEKHIARYSLPNDFSNELHIIGTPEYLSAYGDELRSTVHCDVVIHDVAEGFSHLDIARPENNHLWVKTVRHLMEQVDGSSD